MTNRSNMIPIAGRLHCVAEGEPVCGADEVLYEPEGGTPVSQDDLNERFVDTSDKMDFIQENEYNKPASTGTTGDYPYNGIGRVVLKKNMVGGVNTLTQEAFEDSEGNPLTNTIYVIKYDFVLGENITIPANCVLEFDGGSISASDSNDTITGTNTGIKAGLVKILGTDVTLYGSWNVVEAYPEWFGAKGDYFNDDTDAIQKCLDCFKFCYLTGIYLITQTIIVRTGCKLCGKNKTCFLITRQDTPLISVTGRYAELRDLNIRNDVSLANLTTDSAGIQLNDGLSNSQFTNIYISGCYYGIKGLNNVWQNYFECLRIDKCKIGIWLTATNAAIFNMFVHIYIGECTYQSLYVKGYQNVFFENLNIDSPDNTQNVMYLYDCTIQIKQCNVEGFELQYPIYCYQSNVFFDTLIFTLGTLVGDNSALIMCENGKCFLFNVKKSSADVITINNDVISISGAVIQSVNTELVVQGSATKVQTSISGTTRPTLTNKVQDIGITFFDTDLNRTITWNGSVWVDDKGFTATAIKGTVRPTGYVAGGVLSPARDIGFEFFDTSSGINKPIYVKNILGNGVVEWVDATGTPV